ncbi:hypothetical protein CRYUN_Cryun08bG0062300 [Craigia yunnanensis]
MFAACLLFSVNFSLSLFYSWEHGLLNFWIDLQDKLDFEDPDTEEFMFKDYLKIIMEKEDLTFDDLHRAQFMGENYDDSSDSDKIEDKDAVVTIPDGDCDPDFAVIDNSFGKRKKSQKKLVQKNKIYNLLEAHFADTSGQSSSDENENDSGSCSGIEEEQIMAKWKRQRTLTTDKVPLEKKVAYAVQKSYYASIVAENIKLVYLRRSLVEELLMQPDKFEDKVVGSFIRVKRMPGNCSVGTSFRLLQVTGIKKTSNAKDNRGILLEVSCMPVDIPIDMLNDDDISEEECEDLHQRMKDGLLKQPTVMELEQKAKSLHEDVTKNWIQRELVRLQNKIDFAHEKGRRYMLERFLDEREMLKKSSEQQRLLQKFPRVIAEEIELDPTAREESNCSTGLCKLLCPTDNHADGGA